MTCNNIEIKTDNKQCSICLENICENSLYELECKHVFHVKCIVTWFRTPDKKTCPLCRDDPTKVKETNLQEDVEQLFDLLHEHAEIPEVAQILQLEDQIRARQYDNNFYYKVCGVFSSFIPLASKLKLVSLLFLIGAATTVSTPLIAGGLIINSTVRSIGSGISYLVKGRNTDIINITEQPNPIEQIN